MKLRNASVIGMAGELFVSDVLKRMEEQYGVRYLHNLPVPASSLSGSRTTQVDEVLLSRQMFAAIEVKNWSGAVYCTDDPYWRVVYETGEYKKLNPLIQGRRHAVKLNKLTGRNYRNYAVFPEDTILYNPPEQVIHCSDLIRLIAGPEIYTPEEIEREYQILCRVREENSLNRLADMLNSAFSDISKW